MAASQKTPLLISASSSQGLIFSSDSFCAISRTAGLSSLLWHRKTSKISALESSVFTQREYYTEKIGNSPIAFRDQIGHNKVRLKGCRRKVALTQKNLSSGKCNF